MIKPENSQSYWNIGNQYFAQGDWLNAHKFYNKAFAINDKDYNIYRQISLSLFNLGQHAEAIDLMNKATGRFPRQSYIHYHLGEMYQCLEHNLKAIEHFRQELDLGTRTNQLLLKLGDSLHRIGMVTEGVAFYIEGLRLHPFKDGYSNLMHMAHHDIKSKNSDFRDFTKECYKTCIEPIKKRVEEVKKYNNFNANDLNPHKKIKIGFFSYRFRFAAADYWALNVFKEMNRDKFEIVLYHDSDFEDNGTQEFKQVADIWRQVNNLPLQEVADIVSHDKLDIFVDMIGHMGGGRLELFALKPAPIQVCWLNYYGTLGLPEMDYFIADANVVTEKIEIYFTEKVYKMPRVFNPFTPKGMTVNAEIADTLPVENNGYITFGSLNRFAKINHQVIEHWSNILKAVPTSRLIIYAAVFKEMEMHEYVYREFEKHGVERSRLILELYPSLKEFFLKFNEIDILLDPFPFVGGATTIDAAYMGVPSVTIAGDTWVYRSGVATYVNIDCIELIAENKEDCVSKVVALANDIPRLKRYRQEMRGKLLSSPICDNKQYARDFEDALRFMWQEYCKENSSHSTTVLSTP